MPLSPEQIVIFIGPSLAVDDARRVLEADYRPPIRRGDIDALMKAPPRLIGVIDGKFFQSFAISPKELLTALDAGVKVFGSSSMGALRAVELHPYGMIGVGRIFEMYHTEVLTAEDEVALVYDADSGRATSVPLVNIRIALEGAVREQVIRADTERTLLRLIQAVYFPDRTYPMMLSLAEGKVPEGERLALADYIKTRAPDAKRDDALLLLREIKRFADAG
ncbi:TfuA-related McrA-glycine thioamidation protein [Sorangium sp. So ce363]|uniref:TfuA-related McrA-glycine thioamidation protein n=1 Tax=Sorangium sp. So ce363 TaxID=3133304 RepID=UPI003F609E67